MPKFIPANLSKLSAAQIVLSISFSPFPTRLSSFAQNRVKKQKARSSLFASFPFPNCDMPCLTGLLPLPFHPAAKTPSKTPCFRAFIRGSFKSPFAFSPVYILCIASYSFLSAFRHFFYPASPCAFTCCFFVSLPFLASLCPVLCLPKKLRSEFLQKSPGARVSYLLGIPVRANHLPFYSACTRFVLFLLFPYIFCFHRRHAGFICIKKTGP